MIFIFHLVFTLLSSQVYITRRKCPLIGKTTDQILNQVLTFETVKRRTREKKITEKPLTTKCKKRNQVKKRRDIFVTKISQWSPIQVPTLSDRAYLSENIKLFVIGTQRNDNKIG